MSFSSVWKFLQFLWIKFTDKSHCHHGLNCFCSFLIIRSKFIRLYSLSSFVIVTPRRLFILYRNINYKVIMIYNWQSFAFMWIQEIWSCKKLFNQMSFFKNSVVSSASFLMGKLFYVICCKIITAFIYFIFIYLHPYVFINFIDVFIYWCIYFFLNLFYFLS